VPLDLIVLVLLFMYKFHNCVLFFWFIIVSHLYTSINSVVKMKASRKNALMQIIVVSSALTYKKWMLRLKGYPKFRLFRYRLDNKCLAYLPF